MMFPPGFCVYAPNCTVPLLRGEERASRPIELAWCSTVASTANGRCRSVGNVSESPADRGLVAVGLVEVPSADRGAAGAGHVSDSPADRGEGEARYITKP